VFSYLSPEERVRKDHPLRAVRVMTDEVLHEMSPVFDSMYAQRGRPSIGYRLALSSAPRDSRPNPATTAK
jgi:hypothetical protein